MSLATKEREREVYESKLRDSLGPDLRERQKL